MGVLAKKKKKTSIKKDSGKGEEKGGEDGGAREVEELRTTVKEQQNTIEDLRKQILMEGFSRRFEAMGEEKE